MSVAAPVQVIVPIPAMEPAVAPCVGAAGATCAATQRSPIGAVGLSATGREKNNHNQRAESVREIVVHEKRAPRVNQQMRNRLVL